MLGLACVVWVHKGRSRDHRIKKYDVGGMGGGEQRFFDESDEEDDERLPERTGQCDEGLLSGLDMGGSLN